MNTTTILTETTLPKSATSRRGFFYIKRGLLAIVLLPFVLIAGGFVYETIMQAGDANRYPPPGQMVNVDGYQMHISCTGEGSPTVILESGAGGYSVQHTAEQMQLSADNRVCAYDRAGMGWSEARPETRTAWQIAHELHGLLGSADIAPPYILVGPSNGGLYGRAFAAEFPDETVGLVLLDPTDEASLVGTKGIPNGIYIFMGRIGIFRLSAAAMCPGCNPEDAGAMAAKRGQAITWETYAAEWAALQTPDEIALMRSRMGQAGALGDTPLLVIAANQSGLPLEQAEASYQAALEAEEKTTRALSTNIRYTVVMSDHGLSDQGALVVQSIRDVIAAVRTGQPLAE